MIDHDGDAWESFAASVHVPRLIGIGTKMECPMTSREIRESFLRFFHNRGHTLVPSASLLPDSPNLLFTNAGMNQFVPIFLGQISPPFHPPRAANSQKCIRAGGKHNDLEDVGLDTYHHTFFEMLGNWSFGDYFKKEAIAWAWELLVHQWGFPKERLYATVYRPSPGEPGQFDEESYRHWAQLFQAEGLDPSRHIVFGSKKDNFWMMGETGPCGPCSEIHVDLAPEGKGGPQRVNQGDPHCLEIWNLVFIELDAREDGSFVPLPARHVDTGMGLERVCAIIQGTEKFRRFGQVPDDYQTDLFRPILEELQNLSGHCYEGTLPDPGTRGRTPEQKRDIAFRVIADHIRMLTFAIADGIYPSNEGRGYVVRRVLRRAVRYGEVLGFREPFLHRLVGMVCATLGDAFPEIRRAQPEVEEWICREENNFLRTLAKGMELFRQEVSRKTSALFPAEKAFQLYDTYGFPIDLTQLLAQEEGMEVDLAGFQKLLDEQRRRSQEAQRRVTIEVVDTEPSSPVTEFVGYHTLEARARIVRRKNGRIITDKSPFYAEMGGQVSDVGTLTHQGRSYSVHDVQRRGQALEHWVEPGCPAQEGEEIILAVAQARRLRIEIHHTATHLLHWALREVFGPATRQRGSYVGPDQLRFDFSCPRAPNREELKRVQELVQECIQRDDPVRWVLRPYRDVRNDPTILQFFGEKYGDIVRVVEIGDYSKELCGGTHVRHTGELEWFTITAERAVGAGVRRIEAVAGPALLDVIREELPKREEQYRLWKKRFPELPALDPLEIPDSIRESWQAWERWIQQWEAIRTWLNERDHQKEQNRKRSAKELAQKLLAKVEGKKDEPVVVVHLGEREPGDLLALAQALKSLGWGGMAVLTGHWKGKASLVVLVGKHFRHTFHAGKLVQKLAAAIEGKGGGNQELGQAGGGDPQKLASVVKLTLEELQSQGSFRAVQLEAEIPVFQLQPVKS